MSSYIWLSYLGLILPRKNFATKYMISIPLRMEKPVKSPIVPPITPNCATRVT